jgi:hypothetical protein
VCQIFPVFILTQYGTRTSTTVPAPHPPVFPREFTKQNITKKIFLGKFYTVRHNMGPSVVTQTFENKRVMVGVNTNNTSVFFTPKIKLDKMPKLCYNGLHDRNRFGGIRVYVLF